MSCDNSLCRDIWKWFEPFSIKPDQTDSLDVLAKQKPLRRSA
jgi:hypothetical protein